MFGLEVQLTLEFKHEQLFALPYRHVCRPSKRLHLINAYDGVTDGNLDFAENVFEESGGKAGVVTLLPMPGVGVPGRPHSSVM